ncbi:MAG: Uma2 family endonuclease [Anaerolineae bacterium]|nr:Uma2 family endonuclease [Anaerolineae bacterium]
MDTELVATLTEAEVTRRRFTVTELLHLSKIGFLGNDERVELIRGEIVEMSPINVAHASTVSRLVSLLFRSFGDRVILSVQNPVQLDDETLLQPDIAVLKPQDDYYSRRHPDPEAVLLLIEVSDTTLLYDRRVKRKLYGAAGIIEYWIVDLPNRRIEVYTKPRQDGYRIVTQYAPGETISPLAFPDVALNVDEVLGK